MSAMMRCDSCNALRWYGAPLQCLATYTIRGEPIGNIYLCEMCVEERMITFHDPTDDEHYLPTMHPPHYSKQ